VFAPRGKGQAAVKLTRVMLAPRGKGRVAAKLTRVTLAPRGKRLKLTLEG
jgi:hypothetical protein